MKSTLEEASKWTSEFQSALSDISSLASEFNQSAQTEIDNDYELRVEKADALYESLLQKYHLKNVDEANMTANQKRKLTKIEKQKNDEIAKAEKEKEERSLELKKKYAEKEFVLKVLTIIASTAQAIMAVWAQWGAYPPVAAALSVIPAAIGTAQVVAAKKAKDASQMLETGGDVYGPSHKEGGVNVELEGKEFVINKNAAQIPWVHSIAERLNSINNPGGRRGLGKFASGGSIPTSMGSTSAFSRNDVRAIVEEVVAGVVAIPVQNNPYNTDTVISNNRIVKNQTTW